MQFSKLIIKILKKTFEPPLKTEHILNNNYKLYLYQLYIFIYL